MSSKTKREFKYSDHCCKKRKKQAVFSVKF
jgi:hypothetical protein